MLPNSCGRLVLVVIPNMFELGAIRRMDLKDVFRDGLKQIAFLFILKWRQERIEVMPGPALQKQVCNCPFHALSIARTRLQRICGRKPTPPPWLGFGSLKQAEAL